MSNSNTLVAYLSGANRNQIPTLTLAATTETALPLGTDSGVNTAAILAVPSGTAILGSGPAISVDTNPAVIDRGLPNYGPINGQDAPFYSARTFDAGRPFVLRLIGTGSAAANAGNTLTVKIYQGTSATLGSDTLFTTPLNAVATATAANLRFYISITCFWDSTSQTLTGQLSGSYLYNGTNTLITSAAIPALTGITTYTGLSFLPSITWGNAAGGVISVAEWSLEQV